MSTVSHLRRSQLRYHAHAYDFVFAALKYMQEQLGRNTSNDPDDEDTHLTGVELLYGIRDLARKQYGFLTITVFAHWGVRTTEDFGRIVFELIELDKMKKTDRDQLSDFYDVYSFRQAFIDEYEIKTDLAFKN